VVRFSSNVNDPRAPLLAAEIDDGSKITGCSSGEFALFSDNVIVNWNQYPGLLDRLQRFFLDDCDMRPPENRRWRRTVQGCPEQHGNIRTGSITVAGVVFSVTQAGVTVP